MKTLMIVGLLLALPLFAADVDGKWTGAFQTQNGERPVTFNLKAEGATLTGSMAGQDGTEFKITDGKVDGNNISFNVTIDFGGMPFTMAYKGVVSGAEIKLTATVFDMPLELTVKKAS